MSIATDHLAFFRDQWSDRFTDTCTVTRTTGQTFNTTTGVYEGGTTATRYSGGCLVRPFFAGMSTDEQQFGGEQVELRKYSVFLPYTTVDIVPDDVVTVTSATDAELNGKELIVRNVQTDTYNTRRMLECDDNQGA